MTKKVTVEVFKDAHYPELDSDDVAHALATVDVIKPFVEVINRNRKLKLGDSQPKDILDTKKRLRVVRDTDAIMFFTGRHILAESEDKEDSHTTGIYMHDSRVGVVSTLTQSVTRTSRHELGHYLYTCGGVVSETADELDHCSDENCLMHAYGLTHTRRIIPSKMGRRAAEALGFRMPQFEEVANTTDYCGNCETSLGKSAYILTVAKENLMLAGIIRDGMTKRS